MWRNLWVIFAAGLVVALPFIFRQPAASGAWREGDPVLYIVSPHIEPIRYEFARAFSEHEQAAGRRPVKIEWINIGGTTEIMNYLEGTYRTAARPWWDNTHGASGGMTDLRMMDGMFATKFDPAKAPEGMSVDRWKQIIAARAVFRSTDDPKAFGSGADLFFGGGQYDHSRLNDLGMAVTPWGDAGIPKYLIQQGDVELIPQKISGEIWRDKTYFGCCLSSFGICYNIDRLADLEVDAREPSQWRWEDLADPKLFGQVALCDPSKSGSIAKAFEMLIQEQMHAEVIAAGFTDKQIEQFEKLYTKPGVVPGAVPVGVPAAYEQAVRRGWLRAFGLLRQISGNARYFTDSSSKVGIDVSTGDAAVGMSIDFYARFQAQMAARGADGKERMVYVTPVGGSSISCDPISLLRGAPSREVAVRFIEFVLSEEGQKLWNGRPGTPGGPEKYALRRLPIRRDFYPSTQPAVEKAYELNQANATDDLGSPAVDAYSLGAKFTYMPRWTAKHFGVHRQMIKAMMLDSGDELKAAWGVIKDCRDPAVKAQAMEVMNRMPTVTLHQKKDGKAVQVTLAWENATSISSQFDELEVMRQWIEASRANYREAEVIARQKK